MSKLAQEPARPSMPIEGRTELEWKRYYRPELANFFIELHSHRWRRFVTQQYLHQSRLDSIGDGK